ncbi:MAG: endonuclease, partial [Glaciihabitans sp.]|nr:endonuclease [Glaciihabitans sp.]
MTSSAPALDLVARSTALREVAAALRPDPLLLRDLDDSALLLLQGGWADTSRTAGAHLAAIAGEIARRSDRALGSGGLAQRAGFRSPEELVKASTGLTKQEAIAVVRVGRVVEQNASGGVLDPLTGELAAPREPWLAAAGTALVAGTLSSSQLTAIRTGLGQPTSNVPIQALTTAVENLVTEITTTTPGSVAGVAGVGWDVDRVLLRARELRDAI